MNYLPAYRVTIYAPRSIDPTEATVLTPASGAPHNNPFQVASIVGVAGFKPYLDSIKGQKGTLDPLTKISTIGDLKVSFLDARLTPGGDNLTRWFTAFGGDVKGRVQLLGCKVKIEESLDSGATWVAYYTGVVQEINLDGPVWLSIQVRDRSEELKIRCFVGVPHSSITYSPRTLILPVGLSGPYGQFPVAVNLTGKVTAVFSPVQDVYPYGTRGGFSVTLDGPSIARPDNLLTANLPATNNFHFDDYDHADRRRRIQVTDTTAVWTAEFYYMDSMTGTRSDGKQNVITIAGATLDPSDLSYHAAPALNDLVSIRVYWTDSTPTKENPIFINDIQIAQLWKDVLDGKFGYIFSSSDILPTGKSVGDVKRSYPYDSAAFTTLIADTSIPTARFIIDAPMQMNDFFEKYICQPFNLAYRLDGSGQLVPIDMRLPSTLAGILTITDADMATDPEPTWTITRDTAITTIQVNYYEDEPVLPPQLTGTGTNPPPGMVQVTQQILLDESFGRLDLGDKSFTIDAIGLRYSNHEQLNGQSRRAYILGEILRQISQVRLAFGSAAMEVSIPCLRTSNTDAQIGDWRFIAISKLLDPALNKRGGTRLMRCIGRTEDGPKRMLNFIDAGAGAVAAQPASVAIVAYTYPGAGSASRHAVQINITANASNQAAAIRVAATGTGVGSPPADTSPLWMYARVIQTYGNPPIIAGLPMNSKIWVQARTEPVATDTPQVPSPWLTNATPVTLADPGAPTGLGSSGLTDTQDTWSWTNAVADERPTIALASPSSNPTTQVVILPPGTTSYTVRGTTHASTYKIEVYYSDAAGGIGTKASSTWTASNASTQAPNPGAITIVEGGT